MRKWLRQHGNQRRLALGLLTLAFGCFAQVFWIEAKAELAQALFAPGDAKPQFMACYSADALPLAQQD